MSEDKPMTAEEAFEQLHICQEDEPYVAIIRTELQKRKQSRDLHEQLLKEALDEASPYFQCGGRYADWLVPGQSIFKGIGVLAEKYDELRAKVSGEADGWCDRMDNNEQCSNCKFYREGKCRRRAAQFYTYTKFHPSYDRDTPGTESVESASGWPDVDEDDWCGEFVMGVK